MEEKKRAVAKKLITPNMQEWLPVSPKMPEKPYEESADPETGSEMTAPEVMFEEPQENRSEEHTSELQSP